MHISSISLSIVRRIPFFAREVQCKKVRLIFGEIPPFKLKECVMDADSTDLVVVGLLV